jgi:hypothetical protein
MSARAPAPLDVVGRKRPQRVTDKDRDKLHIVVKHAGLQRGAPSNQQYAVRGVFIDGNGDKRFCFRAVGAEPDFDNPDTVIENDAALGAEFFTAGLTLTDKELAKDLAAAVKEQEEDRRLANPAHAENLARVPAPAAAAAVLRGGRPRFPLSRDALSDTEEDDDDVENALMLEHEENFAEPDAALDRAREGTPRAGEEEARELQLRRPAEVPEPPAPELPEPAPEPPEPAPEPPAPAPEMPAPPTPAPEMPAPPTPAPEPPVDIVDNKDEGDFMENPMWTNIEVPQLNEDSDPEWDDPSKDYPEDPAKSFKPLQARLRGATTAKMRVEGPVRQSTLGLPEGALAPAEVFQIFFNPELQTLVVAQSNLYHTQVKAKEAAALAARRSAALVAGIAVPTSPLKQREFTPLHRGSLMKYVAIIIVMGIFGLGSIVEYWSDRTTAHANEMFHTVWCALSARATNAVGARTSRCAPTYASRPLRQAPPVFTCIIATFLVPTWTRPRRISSVMSWMRPSRRPRMVSA